MRCPTPRAIILMMLLLIAGLLPTLSSAQLVWHDDFEDGDLKGWTVNDGNFTVESGVLKLEGHLVIDYERFHGIIYHPSTGAVGSWSFEIGGRRWRVQFMATSLQGNGYCLVKDYRFAPSFHLMKIKDGPDERLDEYWYWGNATYHHVNITRNNVGHFEVYIDGVLVLEETDDSFMDSSYFIYHPNGNGSALDNVAVVTEMYADAEFFMVLTTGIIGTMVVLVVTAWRYRRRIIVIDG